MCADEGASTFCEIVLCTRTVAPHDIGQTELDALAEPYRGWHYYADPIIPSDHEIPGFERFHSFDVPTVYQIPGHSDTWFIHNPVISVSPGGFDADFAPDPKVFKDGDHWVMFLLRRGPWWRAYHGRILLRPHALERASGAAIPGWRPSWLTGFLVSLLTNSPQTVVPFR